MWLPLCHQSFLAWVLSWRRAEAAQVQTRQADHPKTRTQKNITQKQRQTHGAWFSQRPASHRNHRRKIGDEMETWHQSLSPASHLPKRKGLISTAPLLIRITTITIVSNHNSNSNKNKNKTNNNTNKNQNKSKHKTKKTIILIIIVILVVNNTTRH